MKKFLFNLFLLATSVWAPQLKAQASSPQYVSGSDTLVVYKDVPGLTPSDKYTIRVRSAATNNLWVDVFANYTYNRAAELGGVSVPRNDGTTLITTVYNYAKHTSAWSHTYGNIEMSKNTPVEVEIAAKNGFKIANLDFFKATVHPAQKASLATMNNGKVYFTISNPGQVVIDINGQMDDYNAAINGGVGHPVHAISIFANPVIKKPTLNNPRVYYVEPGLSPVTFRNVSPTTFDTLYFKPGVHDLGQDIKIYPGKVVYLPGDALIYGNMNNKGVPTGGFSENGENIRVYGYGTLSCAKITHEDYVPPSTISSKGFEIENGLNWRVSGISIVDPANHSFYTIGGTNGLLSYVKVITWRANGDGLGGYEPVVDCFIRSQDDCSYAKGYKARCTFWKDANAALFHLATITENQTTPLIIEDCDVLYARLRNPVSTNGGGFQQRGEGTPGQRNVNVIFRNFRIHDKLVNMPIIHLVSYSGGTATAPTDVGSSYKGILFQNISIAGMASGNKQRILGCAASPWYGGLIFDNLTIGGTLVTPENHQTYFTTNEFVRDIWYRMPNYYTITNNSNATQGTFSVNTTETTHIENSTVTLTAVPIAGYAFASWSGDVTGTTNPISLNMSGNKNITANFTFVGTRVLTLNQAANGTIISNPAGTSHSLNSTVSLTAKPAVGYKFVRWSGDLTNTNVVTNLGMNTNKTLSAVFEKTNSFAFNCGGDQYIAADGTLYAQTTDGYTQSVAISGTPDQFLYQSERSSSQNFSYALPVQNGDYTITLKFAEIYFNTANSRIFNVTIEGVAVLTNFDIYAEAGGAYKALDKTFKIKVTDGILNIAFSKVTNNSKISAIKIVNDIEIVPVELTQFNVKKTAKTALLNWTTASEKNNAYFDIEQSTDGKAFQSIGRVKGNGTSQAVTNYDYEHISPAIGVNYYRLQQVDIDGKTTESKTISVSFDKDGTTKIYPTLANGILNVEMSSDMGATDMQIINLLGQVVDTQKVQNTEGVTPLNISHLSSGSYIIRLISKNSSTVYRFEKQ
jgi:Malectin domain/Divergent InlB B-repeat domain/Secretion system C-terminal sorting domain